MNSVFVHATTDVARKDLEDEDIGALGIYEVRLDDRTPTQGRANAALDCFHTNVPVGMLDDFAFTVRESADPVSAAIVSSDEFEGYALGKYAISIDKIDAPFQVLARYQPQAWINDNAVDIDGSQDVDVTQDVLCLAQNNLAGLHSLRDYRDSSDALVERHLGAIGHEGPFSVEVVNAVTKAFGVDSLGDISEAMVEDAAERAAPAVKSAPRPG